MDEENKKGEASFVPVMIVLVLSLIVVSMWDKYPAIKDNAHKILDPTAGWFLNWDVFWGMTILVLIITIFMTIVQKYATDQETLKEMKKEQKALNDEMKKFKDHPEKVMQLQKESMKFVMPMMKLSMRGMIYTGIPLILMFRWFMDYFGSPALEGFKFLGFMNWFWFYLIASIIFSTFIRKWMNVV